MSKKKNVRAVAAHDAKSKTGDSAFANSAHALPLLGLAWVGLLVITAIASLCPRFTAFYAVYLAATIGLAIGALLFMDAIYRKGKTSLHPAFKKFLGYGLVIHYAAAAMPRVDWASDGLIKDGRVVYLFVLAALCLAEGIALFIASGRPRAYAALGLITDEEVLDKALRKKNFAENRKKGLVHGILEWVDALGFAAILVILINTFVFQLYEIPSESMVPAFLKKDRPFTIKLDAGPRIPLTDWRLPFLRLPHRGDIITLANPRYPENQTVNLKKYLSQLVSMVTFTAVNIDKYLPDGSQKADPLVKRIVGVPGEKLMMIDDVLYAKRMGDAAFSPVKDDTKWARTDLWKESADKLARIEELPIDEKHRTVLNDWDARRKAAEPSALAASIQASAKTILSSKIAPSQVARYLAELQSFTKALNAKLNKAEADLVALQQKTGSPAEQKNLNDQVQQLAGARAYFDNIAADIVANAKADPSAGNPFVQSGTKADVLALALTTYNSPRSRAGLQEFAACEASSLPARDDYQKSGRMLNLLIKDTLLRSVAREAEVMAAGGSYDALADQAGLISLTADGELVAKKAKDAELATYLREDGELDYYVNGQYAGLYDERNFPEFPPEAQYLGTDQYFAMGDNRYNSLDFRYKTGNYSVKPMDPADPSSVVYLSNIDPFALDRRFIEGYALFRIWPPSRVGAIR